MVSLEYPINEDSLRLIEQQLLERIEAAGQAFELWTQTAKQEGSKASLEHLRESLESLQPLPSIFTLVDVPGARLISEEITSLLAKLIQQRDQFADRDLSVLSEGFLTLRRYIEFVRKENADIPILAIEHANKLRRSRRSPLLPETHFSGEFELVSESVPLSVPSNPLQGEDFKKAASRIRHMYQVGLLAVISGESGDLHVQLMDRAVKRLCMILPRGQSQSFWLLVSTVLACVRSGGLTMNQTRIHVFMGLEKLLRRLVKEPHLASQSAPGRLEREILFLLSLSSHRAGSVGRVLEKIQVPGASIDDNRLARLADKMMGPGQDATAAVVQQVRKQLAQASDALELMAGQDFPMADDLSKLKQGILSVSNVMRMLGMTSEAELLARQSQKLERAAESTEIGWADATSAVAQVFLLTDMALFEWQGSSDIEQVSMEAPVQKTEIARFAAMEEIVEDLRRVKTLVQDALLNATPLGDETMQRLADSASVSDFVGVSKAGRLLKQFGQWLERGNAGNGLAVANPLEIGETVADVLISLEFYFQDVIAGGTKADDILSLAEESLSALPA